MSKKRNPNKRERQNKKTYKISTFYFINKYQKKAFNVWKKHQINGCHQNKVLLVQCNINWIRLVQQYHHLHNSIIIKEREVIQKCDKIEYMRSGYEQSHLPRSGLYRIWFIEIISESKYYTDLIHIPLLSWRCFFFTLW